jgi:hypothetical protein
MTVKQIISSIPGVPYYNNVVDDWDAKDYSWNVTKKVIEYATYLKDHPESLSQLPPILVLNGKFEDGAHRVSAIWLLQQRMDPKNPLWANTKLKVQFVKQDVAEDHVQEDAVMGKIEQSGKIVRILKKQHTVPFSDEKDWLLIDTDPARGNRGLGLKWIPAHTRFEWVRPYKETVEENFADGRGPGRPGDSQRHGIRKGATMAELEKAAKAPGRKGQLARWQLNMRRGKKK